ncbi:hypothetical protein EJB05_00695, partial [Eragrostis curvula]
MDVVDEQSQSKRCRLISTPCALTSLTIRETSNNTGENYASSDEDVPMQFATTLPNHNIFKPLGVFEQGESSKGSALVEELAMLALQHDKGGPTQN